MPDRLLPVTQGRTPMSGRPHSHRNSGFKKEIFRWPDLAKTAGPLLRIQEFIPSAKKMRVNFEYCIMPTDAHSV